MPSQVDFVQEMFRIFTGCLQNDVKETAEENQETRKKATVSGKRIIHSQRCFSNLCQKSLQLLSHLEKAALSHSLYLCNAPEVYLIFSLTVNDIKPQFSGSQYFENNKNWQRGIKVFDIAQTFLTKASSSSPGAGRKSRVKPACGPHLGIIWNIPQGLPHVFRWTKSRERLGCQRFLKNCRGKGREEN